MKKYIVMFMISLLIANSCAQLDTIQRINQGVQQEVDFYISWIVVQENKHEITLNYPYGQDTILQPISVSKISFNKDNYFITETEITSFSYANISKHIKRIDYNFTLSGIIIPVSFIKEDAVWHNPDGSFLNMPTIEIGDISTTANLLPLQYEIIDSRVFESYLLQLSLTDKDYIKATTEVKILVETFISIDDDYNEIETIIMI